MPNTDPSVYVKQFMAYAATNEIDTTTEAIQQWDAEQNSGRMRAAIVAKYGEKALIEIAIKDLFRRYLYNGGLMTVPPSPDNPPGLSKGVEKFSGIQGGKYIPEMNVAELDVLIAVQTQKFKDAGTRLKLYGLPLKKLHAIIEEL